MVIPKFIRAGLLFVFLLVQSAISYGQTHISNYALSVNFAPAFIRSSTLVIQSGPGAYIRLKVSGTSFVDSAALTSKKLTALTNFMRTYKFQLTNTGLDGITVTGTLAQLNKTRRFAFWSPKKETANYKLISILFDLMNKSFKNQDIINYTENLEQYFPHKLGLKKLSSNPLTYKLYGGISDNESYQFSAFLNSLPGNQNIFIDMSNFSVMGKKFYPNIEDLYDKHKTVYWVDASRSALLQLHEIDIRHKYIISRRKYIKLTNQLINPH